MKGIYTKYGCTYGPKGNRIYETEEKNEREAQRLPDVCTGSGSTAAAAADTRSSSVDRRAFLND